MKKDKTEIVLVVDNSGSMASIKNDTEGGLATFLKEQKELPGECNITYYQFSNNTTKIFENKPIKEVNSINISPSGSTALFDAVGQAIDEVGKRLAQTPEVERPELIIFVISSDGEENASREFTKAQIADKVKHQTDIYKWQFIFLGANFDAFTEGQSYGFQGGKTMQYSTSSAGITGGYASVSFLTSGMRCATDKTTLDTFCFSDSQRSASLV